MNKTIKTNVLKYLYWEVQILFVTPLFALFIGGFIVTFFVFAGIHLFEIIFPSSTVIIDNFTKNNFNYFEYGSVIISGILFIWILNYIYLPFKKIMVKDADLILKQKGSTTKIPKSAITRAYVDAKIPAVEDAMNKIMLFRPGIMGGVKFLMAEQYATRLWLHVEYQENNESKTIAYDATAICLSKALVDFLNSANIKTENLYGSDTMEQIVQGDLPRGLSIPAIAVVIFMGGIVVVGAFLFFFHLLD